MAKNEELFQEISEICNKAFFLALKVFENPNIRVDIAPEAYQLYNALRDRCQAAKAVDGYRFDKFLGEQASEAELDLGFAQADSDIVSLRLARQMRAFAK